MSVGKICTRTVCFASPDEWIVDAARRMRDRDVGSLVVVDTQKLPIGMLTDRDIVVRCMAEGRDPETTPVADVMSTIVSSVSEDTPIETALATMGSVGVRRMVVTDEEGRLAGLLALDDALELLVEEVESIGRLLRAQAPT